MESDDEDVSPYSSSLQLLMINRTPKTTALTEKPSEDSTDEMSPDCAVRSSDSSFSMSSSNTLKAASFTSRSFESAFFNEVPQNTFQNDEKTCIEEKKSIESSDFLKNDELLQKNIFPVNLKNEDDKTEKVISSKKKLCKRSRPQARRNPHNKKCIPLVKTNIQKHKNSINKMKHKVVRNQTRVLTHPRYLSDDVYANIRYGDTPQCKSQIKNCIATENLLRSTVYSFGNETGESMSRITLTDSVILNPNIDKKNHKTEDGQQPSQLPPFKDETVNICSVFTKNCNIVSKSSKTLSAPIKIYAHDTMSDIISYKHTYEMIDDNNDETDKGESFSGMTLKPTYLNNGIDSAYSMQCCSDKTLKPQNNSFISKNGESNDVLKYRTTEELESDHRKFIPKSVYSCEIEATTSSDADNPRSPKHQETINVIENIKNIRDQFCKSSWEVPNMLQKNYSIPNEAIIKAALDDVEMNRDDKSFTKNYLDIWERLKFTLDSKIQKLECVIIDKIMNEVRKLVATPANIVEKPAESKTEIINMVETLDKSTILTDIYNHQRLDQSLNRIHTSLQCDLLENKQIDQLILKLSVEGSAKQIDSNDGVSLVKKPFLTKKDLDILKSPIYKVISDENYAKGDLVTVSISTEESTANETFYRIASYFKAVYRFFQANCIVIQTIPMFFIIVAASYCLIVVITRTT